MTPTIAVVKTPEPSIAELRMMVEGTEPTSAAPVAAEPVEAKAETPETEAAPTADERTRDEHGRFAAKDKTVEADAGTAEIQKPIEAVEVEEPLPENVQKRIAKESEKQARIQAEINQAVSQRKAKEAELAKLKADTGNTGSEPATTTEPAKNAKPTKPKFADFSAEGKSYADYQSAVEEFEVKNEAWVLSEAERRADERYSERERKRQAEETIAKAEIQHGAGWQEARARVIENAPENLQRAISALDTWDGIVAHLGKEENAAELKDLSVKFAKNPYAAIAELGRLEDRLKKPATQPETAKAPPAKPLKAPPLVVGGAAGAAPTVNLQTADMRTFKREIQTLLQRS